ncbi:hypothetical protein MMC14_000351 [Varicellaria rhodocarpa]|nr:hypothetical protein [Varicellaria rhodocarpa]
MAPTIEPHRPRPKTSGKFTGVPDSNISLDGHNTLEGESMSRLTSVVANESTPTKNPSRKFTGALDNQVSLDGNYTLEGKSINPKVGSVVAGERTLKTPADAAKA